MRLSIPTLVQNLLELLIFITRKGNAMNQQSHMMTMSYWRFAAMIVTCTLVMFALMYFNTYAWMHVEYSQTRAWMALLMGATMAIVMLAFMWSMYGNRYLNIAIVSGSLILGSLSLWLVRSQETVDDLSYMRAMIPHHSIAIMTSERAHIRDARVRQLADGIIRAQIKEIGEMKMLIADLQKNPPLDAAPILQSYRKRGELSPIPE